MTNFNDDRLHAIRLTVTIPVDEGKRIVAALTRCAAHEANAAQKHAGYTHEIADYFAARDEVARTALEDFSYHFYSAVWDAVLDGTMSTSDAIVDVEDVHDTALVHYLFADMERN